ncbi:unnamed protein product, partial [Didymodactylos carnosus]
TTAQFYDRLAKTDNHSTSHNQYNYYITQAYDVVWTVAYIVKKSIERGIPLEKFDYRNRIMTEIFLKTLRTLNFNGVSGPISFEDQNRKAQTLISQLQNGTIKRIAEYSDVTNMLNFHCLECGRLIWHNKMPIDQQIIEYTRQCLGSVQMIIIVCESLDGIMLSIFFVSFTVKYRHERYIKLSSPNLNNVLVIGCVHIYLAILLLGIEEWFMERKLLGYACMLRTFLFTTGFSLTFGSMFLKTLRVYRIFTSTGEPLLHSKLLQDRHLVLICSILYFIDLFYCLLWQIFNPYTVHKSIEEGGMLDVDTILFNEIYYCESHYRREIFILIYIYKSIFLFFGGYLAFKTKHVHITALNDSRYIGWSIYIVLITSVFSVIMLEFTRSLNRQLVYVCISLSIIIATTSILCLVFLPKVYKIKNKRNLGKEIVSNNLVMEARTRRFAIGVNHFEEYRYAQIQNRELKTELTQLNTQVHRLERRIEEMESVPKNATLAFLPLAVQLASTFLYKHNEGLINTSNSSREVILGDVTLSTMCNKHKSEHNLPEHLHAEQESSSSEAPPMKNLSELSLSIALQYSSSLNSFDAADDTDNDVEEVINDNTQLPLLSTNPYGRLRFPFMTSCSSDNESIIYSKLPNELEARLAEMDSDIERYRTKD